MITSPNQACLLPGHMIKANGPSSMQASSKPTTSGTNQSSFLPPQASQNQQVLLSASYEKLNLWNPSQQQHNGNNNTNQNASKSNPK